MASGSRAGRGSRARGEVPAARDVDAAPTPTRPDDSVPGARFADLPAADLVGLLVRSNRRASDFVDAALVLAERERRLSEADEAAARSRAAAEAAEAEIRRLAAATEERLQAEIREWRRRAAEAEARLLRVQAGGVAREADGQEEGLDAGTVARGVVVRRPPNSLKKRMLRAWESETNAIDEAEAAWEEDRDALAIVPQGQVYDLPKASFGSGDVGEERTHMSVDGDDDHGSDYQVAPENDPPLGHFGHETPVALAIVAPGHELPPNDDDDVVEAGGQEPEPEVTETAAAHAEPDEPEVVGEKSTVTATGTRQPPIKKGMFYKMVFKALKEKEREASLAKQLAAASQPSLRCWLYAPSPKEPVAKEEEGPDDEDEDALQQ